MYTEPNLTQTMTVNRSLHLLSEGFKQEFAEFVYADERMAELLHQLASEFVTENIPVVDEDLQVNLGFMLMETLDIKAR